MATEPIDPSALKSWEDAFVHPIPQVRQLERQLRTDLSANKEKLRGLVGESYRDLLQTAERIIEMDVAAHKVEYKLGEASRNCNSRLLDRKARNLRDFQNRVGRAEREKYTFAAQLAVLQACPSVLARLLHKDNGDRCLLAAKVFVVSRLLLKSFSEKSSIPLISSLRSQIYGIRTIILQHVDSVLSSATLDIPTLVSTLTAFSVLKTSSPSEALRHFLCIRSTSILLVSDRTPDADAILKSVLRFNKTLVDTDSIFPKKLSNALVSLKSASIVQDGDVASLPELGLGINSRWFPDDIRGFTPWIRHDDLDLPRVKELANVWAGREISRLNENLEKAVREMVDIEDLVKLRQEMLASWRSGARTRRKFVGNGEEFRPIIMARINAVVHAQVKELHSVAGFVKSLLGDAEKEDRDSTSLWSKNLLSMDLGNGAEAFRSAVGSRIHGKTAAIQSFLKTYNSWLSNTIRSAEVVRSLQTPPSTLHDDDDDFELEEVQTAEGIEDSEIAETELEAMLHTVYRELEENLSSLVNSVAEAEFPPVQHATFLLRVIRQIRQLPPKRDDETLLPLTWFGVTIIPNLHNVISVDVTRQPIQLLADTCENREWSGDLVSKSLWEGEPALPVLPSPLVFRFLHSLVKSMSAVGEDIWTPTAVKCLKAIACDNIWKVLKPALEGRKLTNETVSPPASPPQTNVGSSEVEESSNAPDGKADGSSATEQNGELSNGTSEPPPTPTPTISSDWILQLLFDALYLDEVLHRRRKRRANGSSSHVASLAAKVDSVIAGQLNLEEAQRMRLEGVASEYWKKTGLLFSLLSI